jgi:hypothetical protein
MLLATTQALHAAQQRLHGMSGLYRAEAALRANPGHYTLAEHFNTARHLQIALIEEWRLQQFLPTEAPNDPPQHLPGAA